MAHGRDADADRALRIAVAAMTASLQLDPDRSRLYGDLVAASLGAAARRELQAMDPSKYVYKSEFAKHYIALGRNEGRTEGEARGEAKGKLELTTRLLRRRFGRLSAAIRARLAAASPDQLDQIAERLLDAATIDEVFRDR